MITGIDSPQVLDQAIAVADSFTPMSDEEMDALLARTKSAAVSGDYELFKTTSIFDATTSNPEWMGEEPERIQRLMSM